MQLEKRDSMLEIEEQIIESGTVQKIQWYEHLEVTHINQGNDPIDRFILFEKRDEPVNDTVFIKRCVHRTEIVADNGKELIFRQMKQGSFPHLYITHGPVPFLPIVRYDNCTPVQ